MPRLEHIPRAVLSSLDVESLAAAVRLRGRDDPGMRFARLGITGSPEKQVARKRAADQLMGDDLRSFLTLPGMFFAFEWMLLQRRERKRVFRDNNDRSPERTFIAALEREPEIYRGAVRYIPKLHKGHIKQLDSIPGARYSMRTALISRYHQITFEKYAYLGIRQDAAFLDFCGPLTRKRCEAIAAFCRLSGPKVVIVNWMNGRYHAGWNGNRAFETLIRSCGEGEVTDDHRYGQFRQVAINRRAIEAQRAA